MNLEVGYKLPPLAEECQVPASAFDAGRWPEFLALAKRLGIAMDCNYQGSP